MQSVRAENALADGRHLGDTQPLGVPVRSVAARRPIRLGQQRKVRHADQRFVRLLQRHQHTPEPVSAHEVACPVDRIQDPSASARPFLARPLLAQNAVLRELALDCFPHQPFVFPIRDRHGRSVGLRVGYHTAGAYSPGVLSRSRCDPPRELQFPVIVHSNHHATAGLISAARAEGYPELH
jgi:hypothetical protein